MWRNTRGRIMAIKIEKITVTIAYDDEKTETAFDSIIESIHEGEIYDDYKLLEYDNPVEYEIVKKKK